MKKGDTLFIIMGMLAMSLAFTSTDIYIPALPTIQHYFSTSINYTQYTISTYLLGLAIAQLTAGPIVDHIGYRKCFLPSIFAFILATILCILATNILTLIVARVFQALFAGSLGITARASFIRKFTSEETSHIFITYAPFIILSGVIAPIIGGYVVYYFNWQSVFIFLVLYGCLLLWLSYQYFYVKEEPLQTKLRVNIIIKNYITILKNGDFVQCILINGIYLGIIFCYLSEAPFIYHAYHYSTSQIGLTFIPIAIAFLSASQLTRYLKKKMSMNQFIILAYSLILIGLGIMAIPAFYPSTLTLMTLGISIAVFGMGFSNPLAFGKGMTLFPKQSGTASSLLTALPFIGGTLLTLLVHPVCGNNIGLLAIFLGSIATFCVAGYYALERAKKITSPQIINNVSE